MHRQASWVKWVGLCLVFSLAGCQPVGRYLRYRALDLADCFSFQVAPGTAWSIPASVGVEISSFVPIGLGYTTGKSYGFRGRQFGEQEFKIRDLSLLVYALGFVAAILYATADDYSHSDNLNRPHSSDPYKSKDPSVPIWSVVSFIILFGMIATFGLFEPPKDFEGVIYPNPKHPGWNKHRYGRVGGHVGLGPIYVSAEIEAIEILDFALGIFGLDLCGDDQDLWINKKDGEDFSPSSRLN